MIPNSGVVTLKETRRTSGTDDAEMLSKVWTMVVRQQVSRGNVLTVALLQRFPRARAFDTPSPAVGKLPHPLVKDSDSLGRGLEKALGSGTACGLVQRLRALQSGLSSVEKRSKYLPRVGFGPWYNEEGQTEQARGYSRYKKS